MFYSLENTRAVSLQRTPPLSPICLSFERGQKNMYLFVFTNAVKIFLLCKHTIEKRRLYYNTFKVASAENTRMFPVFPV